MKQGQLREPSFQTTSDTSTVTLSASVKQKEEPIRELAELCTFLSFLRLDKLV